MYTTPCVQMKAPPSFFCAKARIGSQASACAREGLRLASTVTDEVRPGILGNLRHCYGKPGRDAVDRGIDEARQRHQCRIDNFAHRRPFVCQRPRRRQRWQRQIIAARSLGRTAIERQGETSFSFLRDGFLVEAPGQGFIELPPRHGDGIGRRVRLGEGLSMA